MITLLFIMLLSNQLNSPNFQNREHYQQLITQINNKFELQAYTVMAYSLIQRPETKRRLMSVINNFNHPRSSLPLVKNDIPNLLYWYAGTKDELGNYYINQYWIEAYYSSHIEQPCDEMHYSPFWISRGDDAERASTYIYLKQYKNLTRVEKVNILNAMAISEWIGTYYTMENGNLERKGNWYIDKINEGAYNLERYINAKSTSKSP